MAEEEAEKQAIAWIRELPSQMHEMKKKIKIINYFLIKISHEPNSYESIHYQFIHSGYKWIHSTEKNYIQASIHSIQPGSELNGLIVKSEHWGVFIANVTRERMEKLSCKLSNYKRLNYLLEGIHELNWVGKAAAYRFYKWMSNDFRKGTGLKFVGKTNTIEDQISLEGSATDLWSSG